MGNITVLLPEAEVERHIIDICSGSDAKFDIGRGLVSYGIHIDKKLSMLREKTKCFNAKPQSRKKAYKNLASLRLCVE